MIASDTFRGWDTAARYVTALATAHALTRDPEPAHPFRTVHHVPRVHWSEIIG